jgi:hypothetical protein
LYILKVSEIITAGMGLEEKCGKQMKVVMNIHITNQLSTIKYFG